MAAPKTLTVPANFLSIPGVRSLPLDIAAVTNPTRSMRRISFTGSALDDFEFEPGQDLMVPLSADGERTISRRYTIRQFDRSKRLIDLDIVLHGDGPGVRWAGAVQQGDRVELAGPRGKILLDPDADWHLFAGDETAVPVTFAMIEALAAGVPALAYLEVDRRDDDQPFSFELGPKRQVVWLHRGDTPAAQSTLLAGALASAKLPAGRGHAYVNGEVGLASALRRTLLARGLSPEQVSAKAYWGLGKANGGHGEPLDRAA